jgi:PAS domain S-box-containing protein
MSCTCKKNRSLDYRDNPMKVIYAHDLDGNLTFLNRHGEQLLGYSCEEARHMNISEIVTPELARRVCDETIDSTNRNIGMVYEIEVIAKDGHRVPLEISTSLVFRQGQPVEIEGIAVPPIR